MTKVSVLDLTPIFEGGDIASALANGVRLAQAAERLGFYRYWVAEHHNMPGIGSAATSVVIGHVAAATSTIRVGAGGIMLPNHAPLVIAEQFGTLEALFPGRIDLGVGRAPGTDATTAQALRSRPVAGLDGFPSDVVELLGFLGPPQPDKTILAVPGGNSNVPVWILGSSTYGAQLAAALGLPFAFAAQFGAGEMDEALLNYRKHFRPGAWLDKPYLMVATVMAAADTDAEAQFLASSMHQAFVNMRAGRRGAFPPPVEGYYASLSGDVRTSIDQAMSCAIIGGPETVQRDLAALIQRTGADEIMASNQIFDQGKRVAAYEILANAAGLKPSHGA